jgi:hypothetical protein
MLTCADISASRDNLERFLLPLQQAKSVRLALARLAHLDGWIAFQFSPRPPSVAPSSTSGLCILAEFFLGLGHIGVRHPLVADDLSERWKFGAMDWCAGIPEF